MQPQNQREIASIERLQRHQDALTPPDDDFVDMLREDTIRIDHMLTTDSTLTYKERHELYQLGINTRLDWLYAEQGGKSIDFAQFEAEAKEAAEFISEAEHHAANHKNFNPLESWGIRMKGLDLLGYRAHRALKESQTTLRGTPSGENVRALANKGMEVALRQSARLMKDMEVTANMDGKLGEDTRGLLYELMVTTYARYQTFDRENFDDVFVRTALSREDRPWNGHVYPKRSFDIVIDDGSNTRYLQAKTYNNTDEYAAPIEKVMDKRFHRTRADLRKYVADFNVLVTNSPDPNAQSRIQAAGRELDRVFGAMLDEASVIQG